MENLERGNQVGGSGFLVAFCVGALCLGLFNTSKAGEDTTAKSDAPAQPLALIAQAQKLRDAGKFAQALPLAQEAVQVYRETAGTNTADYARCLRELASTYEHLQAWAQALPIRTELVELRRKTGDTHDDYATALNNLALCHEQLKNFEQARALFEQAVKVGQNSDKARSEDQAIRESNLARHLTARGMTAESAVLWENVLAIRLNLWGEKDIRLVTDLETLARLYSQLEQFEKALPLYERIVDLKRLNGGERSEDFATAINNLGVCHEQLKHLEKARDLFVQALTIVKTNALAMDENQAIRASNLAQLLLKMGEVKESARWSGEALSIRRKSWGDADERTADEIIATANKYCVLNLVDQAMPLIQSASAIAAAQRSQGNYKRAYLVAGLTVWVLKNASLTNRVEFAGALREYGYAQMALEKHEAAEALFQQCLNVRKSLQGDSHREVAQSLADRAMALSWLDRDKEALDLATQSMEMRKRLINREDPEYTEGLELLGWISRWLGHTNQALDCYREAIAIRRKVQGEEHLDLAKALNGLAWVYVDMGQASNAVPLHLQALRIQNKVLAAEHPERISSLEAVANSYEQIESYESALPVREELVALRRKTHQRGSGDFAISLYNLGWCLDHLNKLKEARTCYEEAVEEGAKSWDADSEEQADRLRDLARLLLKQNERAGAASRFEESLAIRTKLKEVTSAELLPPLLELARLYDELKQSDKALPLRERIVEMRGSTSQTNTIYANAINDLALCHEDLGHYETAKEMFERAIRIYLTAGQGGTQSYGVLLANLAHTLGKMGQPAKAVLYREQVLTIQRKLWGDKDPRLADYYYPLIDLYTELKEYEKAEPLHRALVELRQKSAKEKPEDYANALNNLAVCLAEMNSVDKALGYYEQAITAAAENGAGDTVNQVVRISNLARLLAQRGETEKAAELYGKALEIENRESERLDILAAQAALYLQLKQFDKAAHLYGQVTQLSGKLRERRALYSLELVKAAVEAGRESGMTNTQYYASALTELCKTCEGLGLFKSALKTYQELLAVQTKLHGEESLPVAECAHDLARMLSDDDQYTAALPLAERSLRIRQKLAKDRLPHAQSLDMASFVHRGLTNATKAMELCRQAVDLRRELQGDQHPEYAFSVVRLAQIYEDSEREKDAQPLLEEALRIQLRQLGAHHEQTLETLADLTSVYETLDDTNAPPLYERAVQTFKEILGSEAPETCEQMLNLADAYESRANYVAAELNCRRALSIQQEKFGRESLTTTGTMLKLASLLRLKHDFRQERKTLQEAFQLRRPLLPDGEASMLELREDLASVCLETGAFYESEAGYRWLLQYQTRELGETNQVVSRLMTALAVALIEQQKYGEAQILLKKVLALEETRGDKSALCNALSNLACSFRDAGEYEKAEPLYRRALVLAEQSAQTSPENLQSVLLGLANLYSAWGDYEKEEALLVRCFELSRQRYGIDHPEMIAPLHNLAVSYRAQENYTKAEAKQRQALDLCHKYYGPEDAKTRTTSFALASLYMDMGYYDEASRTLRDFMDSRGTVTDDETFARYHNQMGWIAIHTGRYGSAIADFEKALKYFRRTQGSKHPNTIASLSCLASATLAAGQPAKAEPLLREELNLRLEKLDLSASVQSERQQLIMQRNLARVYSRWLDCALQTGIKPEEMLTKLVQWRGQVALRQRSIRAGTLVPPEMTPEAQKLRSDYDKVTQQLAHLAMQRSETPQEAQAKRRKLHELTDRKESLEALMASQNIFNLAADTNRSALEAIRSGLAKTPAVCFIAFVTFSHHNVAKSGKGPAESEEHIVALVLPPTNGPIKAISLGPAAPIRSAVDEWRKLVGNVPNGFRVGRQLKDLVWAKLQPELGNASTVLVSADEPLCRLPFGALPGAKEGTYLIEEFAFAIQPVPRLLPEIANPYVPGKQKESLLAIGDVDYAADLSQVPTNQPSPLLAALQAHRAAPSLVLRKWGLLTATRDEVLALRDSFEQRFEEGNVKLLRKHQATKQQVCEIAPGYRYLHFATHGYFADQSLRSFFNDTGSLDGDEAEPSLKQDVSGWNPGLLSGLVLAGANNGGASDRDDGILTALEVQALDLHSVNLAVLSACETGLGESAAGEGVLGLQRAFQIAGARTTVASLWKVPDQATQTLMSEFYRRLWELKQGKLEALRGAQLWLVREGKGRGVELNQNETADAPNTLSPEYWAAFVLSGEWQ